MSLRARVVAAMALVALVLAGAAAVVAATAQRYLVAQVDAQLIASDVGVRPGGAGRPGPGGHGPRPDRPLLPGAQVGSYYVATLDGTGTPQTIATPDPEDLGVSDGQGARDPLPAVTADDLRRAAATRRPITVTNGDGDVRYRMLLRSGGGRSVLVGAPLVAVDAAVGRLVGLQLTAVAAVVAVLGMVTWWVIRLGVRPVKEMAATASAIGAGDLSRRVDVGDARTEAGELGGALNLMLGRLEDAFEQRRRSEDRLRRFVADASHELRTPVTTIRGYAELYRAGGLADPSELAEAMRRTEQEATRMGSLVDDLLHLARLDQGRPLLTERVDLAALAADAVRDARAVEPQRPIDLDAPAPTVVLGDEPRLRQVAANLVGNALVHTPPGTPVRVAARVEGDTAVLEVADEGPGMAAEAAERAFERFFRADPARARHRGGSGLGLSIVDATVRALGGVATLRSVPGAGTTVRVELPLADAAP